jgi:hypothetical protein
MHRPSSPSQRLIIETMLVFRMTCAKVLDSDAGWSSLAARRAHNPKVTGSNPVPATKYESPNLS